MNRCVFTTLNFNIYYICGDIHTQFKMTPFKYEQLNAKCLSESRVKKESEFQPTTLQNYSSVEVLFFGPGPVPSGTLNQSLEFLSTNPQNDLQRSQPLNKL